MTSMHGLRGRSESCEEEETGISRPWRRWAELGVSVHDPRLAREDEKVGENVAGGLVSKIVKTWCRQPEGQRDLESRLWGQVYVIH
jgi:hypothetical protein